MPSSKPQVLKFLTADQLTKLYNQQVAQNLKVSPLQKDGLESAAYSPVAHNHYHHEKDIHQLAGILAYKIIKNHAYLDGNKRLALVAVDMFFKINQHKLDDKYLKGSDDKDLINAHAKAATGADDKEPGVLAALYKKMTKPIDQKKEHKSLLSMIHEYEKGAQSA